MIKNNLINLKVKDNLIGIMKVGNVEYISLTDIARYKNPDNPSDVLKFWMSNKNSFEFYSLWEELFNPDFNSVESHRIKVEEVGYELLRSNERNLKYMRQFFEMFTNIKWNPAGSKFICDYLYIN